MTASSPSPVPAKSGRESAYNRAAAFSAELRALRARAGSPSYRTLARATNFAVSTVADALSGRRLPTEQVVRAIAAACGEDPDRWAQALHAAANPAPAPPPPAETPEDHPGHSPADPVPTERPPVASALARRLWSPALAGALAALLAGATTGFLAGRGTTAGPAAAPRGATTPPSASVQVPTAIPSAVTTDGQDPVVAKCTADAQLADMAAVLIHGTQVGALELKYSTHCGSGWARLYLYPGRPLMLGTVAVRAGDGRESALTEPLLKQLPIYTNVVLPGPAGCLGAHATVLDPGTAPVTATIPCRTFPR